jgi:hypothetical protein
MKIGDIDIEEDGRMLSWIGPLSVDADGSPFAYAPIGSGLQHLDDLKDAGRPGNWYGILTDTDKKDGVPIIQGPGSPNPGGYISPTSLVDHTKALHDWRRYVDAMTVPYIAIPPELKEEFNVSMGDVCSLNNVSNGRTCTAVVAEIGPHGKIGEGSIALAVALGLSGDPRHGGTDHAIIAVKLWVRSNQGWPRSQEEISAQVRTLLAGQSKGSI